MCKVLYVDILIASLRGTFSLGLGFGGKNNMDLFIELHCIYLKFIIDILILAILF